MMIYNKSDEIKLNNYNKIERLYKKKIKLVLGLRMMNTKKNSVKVLNLIFVEFLIHINYIHKD